MKRKNIIASLIIIFTVLFSVEVYAGCVLQLWKDGAGNNNTGSSICRAVCGQEAWFIPCDSDLFEDGDGAGVVIID